MQMLYTPDNGFEPPARSRGHKNSRINPPLYIVCIHPSAPLGFHNHKHWACGYSTGRKRSFVFDKSVMRRILDVDNDTWVITCGKDIRGPKNQLVVPSENMDFNEFAMRFVVDLIIARLKQYEFEKK